MKGERVKVAMPNLYPYEWGTDGVVIAENDDTVGIRLDSGPVPVIIRKSLVRVLTV